MPLRPGDKLGPYEILAPLGAGGMGEVYRARDKRLNRDVALKVLPDDFANDPARRRRFEQEARAVAALNHPNIVAIYDVGENFLVSELVDGQTLRHAGKLSQRQAIDLAVQIAEGLAAAHAAGITHRDLKPENIMVTRDGRAKILDFGLAKLVEPSVPGSQAPTETQEGMILGTVGYMSPEQVKAQAADHRSDIFSFGLVLYEMLAGKRAFSGESTIEVMSAILKEDAPDLPESVSAPLRRIVGHCIEKNPDQRFQSARDLAFALQGALSIQTAAAMPESSSRRWILAVIAALAIAAISVAALLLLWPSSKEDAWTGVLLGGPEMALNARPSPDGHLLAFAAMVDGLTQIAVMKPESGNWTILTHDRSRGQAFNVSWSPDGSVIYYDRSNGVLKDVKSVPVLGGDEHLVLGNAGSPEVLPDGTLIVVKLDEGRNRRLFHFWPATGRLQQLPVQTDRSLAQNTSSRAYPDGKRILYCGAPILKGQNAPPKGLFAFDLATESSTRVSPPGLNAAELTAYAVAADGKSALAVVNAGTLARILSFSPGSGRHGPTEQTLFTTTSPIWYLSAAPDNNLYASMVDRPSDLAQFSTDGSRFEKLATFPMVPEEADIMTILPDGRTVLSVRTSGQNRLMVVEKGRDPVALVNTSEETSGPLATCGTNEVAFMKGPDPHDTITFTEPATGRIVRTIAPGKGRIESMSCSPNGDTIHFVAQGVVWSMPSPGGEAKKVRIGDRVVADPSGRNLIVQVRESSLVHLIIVPLDGSPEREIPLDRSFTLSGSPLSSSGLSADGRLLAPLSPRDSWFNPPATIDVRTGRIARIPSDNQSDYRAMGWTKDGQVIALRNGLRATLWKFQLVNSQ